MQPSSCAQDITVSFKIRFAEQRLLGVVVGAALIMNVNNAKRITSGQVPLEGACAVEKNNHLTEKI